MLVKWGVTEAWYPATISKAHVLDGVMTYDIVWDQGGQLPPLSSIPRPHLPTYIHHPFVFCPFTLHMYPLTSLYLLFSVHV